MRERDRRILSLALPMVGGMVSQNILNLVDLAMVGQFGNAAVAAVGIGGFANFFAVAFVTGLSAAVQAMSARRLGEGRHGELAQPLNSALVLAIGIAVPLSIVLYACAPAIVAVLNPDPEVVAHGVPYLRARLVAVAAVGMNFAFRGYWNGTNRPGVYMSTLLVMHASNIVLNWVLIFGNLGAPRMGAAGAGIATSVATVLGTAVYVALGIRHARSQGFLRSRPTGDALRTVLRLAWPTGVQQLALAGGYNALFWIIGHIPAADGGHATAEVAAANALINVTLVAILPGMAFGMAAASLCGQALGRGEIEDAYRWAWDVARLSAALLACLGLPMIVAPDEVLRMFLHDAEALALARFPLRLVGASMALEGFGLVMMNALLGVGASRWVARVLISVQWGVFLPLAYGLGPWLGFGLTSIWVAQVGFRAVLAVAWVVLWRGRGWTLLRV